MDARQASRAGRASNCPTGAGGASTTGPTSAARIYFANLVAYETGQPYAFTQQQGNGDLALLEKQVGAYVKDDWQIRPGLTIDFGMRYDWQNYFHDTNNFAPRLAVAYAPGNGKANVIRAGVGVFNDRSGPVVIADVLHSQPGGLTKIVITDPGYPDPFGSAAAAVPPPSIVQLAPDVQIPQSVQYSVSFDHQITKRTTVSLGYTGARGYHLFRSRDINAPLPPQYLDTAGSRVRRHSPGRVERPAERGFTRRHPARPHDPVVQRPGAVHVEPDVQRHRGHQCVSGERLRPLG